VISKQLTYYLKNNYLNQKLLILINYLYNYYVYYINVIKRRVIHYYNSYTNGTYFTN
jgi:hypothetical protein